MVIFAFGKTSQGLFEVGKVKLHRNEAVVEASSNMRRLVLVTNLSQF